VTPRSEHGDSEHYFSTTPAVASRPAEVTLALPDLTVTLGTDRGVFSADRIDSGTKLLLLETAPRGAVGPCGDLPPGDLVDVGCGYGPVAVVLALRHPDRTVWAVDPNARARSLCVANCRTAGVGDRVRVVAPDEVPDDLRVAAIASNPPIRIGKAALHELLTSWLDRLVPGGSAWLVVQRNLGADSLARWLAEQDRPVQRLASRRGYRVLRVGPSGEANGVDP
jgi:16S rRNA (guanine1207-N2)-methyltransferase